MVKIIKEDLDIEEALKKKLEFIRSFCNTNCEIKKGSIRTIERTKIGLADTIKEKDNEISFLKSKINDLKRTLDYWKDKFQKLISFLHDKLHSWYDKDDKYIDVVNNMYEDNVLDDDDIEELNLSKEKDDFER